MPRIVFAPQLRRFTAAPEVDSRAGTLRAALDDAFSLNPALTVNRTRDGGKTFESLRAGLPQQHGYDLIYRHGLAVAGDGQSLLVGSTSGNLWASANAGDEWQTVSLNLPPIHAVRFG